MAFKMKIAYTVDMWFFLIISEKLFSWRAFPRLIGLYKPEPQGRIAAATFFLAVRYLQRFHCNASKIVAISPTFSLQCLRHFRCNASKIVVISSTFSLQCLRHFLSFCYLGVISQNMSRPFLSFLSLWNFHNQGSTSTLFNSSLVIEQQCSMWSCFPSFHLY